MVEDTEVRLERGNKIADMSARALSTVFNVVSDTVGRAISGLFGVDVEIEKRAMKTIEEVDRSAKERKSLNAVSTTQREIIPETGVRSVSDIKHLSENPPLPIPENLDFKEAAIDDMGNLPSPTKDETSGQSKTHER